jgi:hypothetical protein
MTKIFFWISAGVVSALFSAAAAALSGEPYEPAAPDSPIVRKLLAIPIPEDTRKVNYVAAALEMLAHKSAQTLYSYLERSEWLAAMGEPPLKAATVGEALVLEEKAEPLDNVRRRAFETILRVELGKPDDILPEGIRADRSRYRQVSPVVWDLVEQNPDAPVRLLHLAVTNAGKRDLAGIRTQVFLNTTPPVEIECNPQTDSAWSPVLRAGQRRIMFCATNWQHKVAAQTLVDAAETVRNGGATVSVRPRWILIHGAAFDLQDGGAGSTRNFYRRPWQSTGGLDNAERWKAAALVRESTCLDRGTCLRFLSGGTGELQPILWMALGAGSAVFVIAGALSGFRVRAKTLWIITAAFAAVPILVFAGMLGSKSAGLGALIVPVIGSYIWAAFAIGLWGAWGVFRLFGPNVERREVDDRA